MLELSLRFSLSEGEVRVKQYPYRTARLIHSIVQIPRDKRLEKALAEASGKLEDNHTVYEVEYSDGKSFAIACSDSKMTVGIGAVETRW